MSDVLVAGFRSSYRPDVVMNHVYLTALPDGAGEAVPHVYAVEPTGTFEDDPNVTDERFPGPARSFRTGEPLRGTAPGRRRGDRLDTADPRGAAGVARPAGRDPSGWW